jgi:hypothetical protein
MVMNFMEAICVFIFCGGLYFSLALLESITYQNAKYQLRELREQYTMRLGPAPDLKISTDLSKSDLEFVEMCDFSVNGSIAICQYCDAILSSQNNLEQIAEHSADHRRQRNMLSRPKVSPGRIIKS